MLNVHVRKQKHNYILEQEVKHFDFQKAMHGPILISIKSYRVLANSVGE